MFKTIGNLTLADAGKIMCECLQWDNNCAEQTLLNGFRQGVNQYYHIDPLSPAATIPKVHESTNGQMKIEHYIEVARLLSKGRELENGLKKETFPEYLKSTLKWKKHR